MTKEACATELEVFEYERCLEALTLPEASRESGYSTAHISRLISEGKLENVGKRRTPMVRRGDLPKKRAVSADGPDLTGKVGTGAGNSSK
jgi:hypothetical protein